MATAGDGKTPYESGGAGGKFRKRPFRRGAPATPYDRPPTPLRNNNPGLLTKLVDPASRLISAGAHRLYGVFRNRLPSLSLQGPPEINEAQNVAQEAVKNNCIKVSEPSIHQGGNSASISAAAGISDLEHMLKQKTFTRSEIQMLTALLHSRTTEPPSDDVERDVTKLHGSPSSLLRLEASTSGSLKKYGDERDNFFHADISTSMPTSRVLEEEIRSPAELAKAYMGSRPMKVAPREDVMLLNNSPSGFTKTPISSSLTPKTVSSFRGLENGFLTPRSRGRSAMYSMARTPYSRAPSTYTQKGINSDSGHGAALTSSQSTWKHEGRTALKRRSSVLDDDFGSGGPLRRIRQKANLASHMLRDKRELGYTALQQPDDMGQKLFLMNKPEPNVSENGDTSKRGSGSGYGSVPTKSTETANKILQQLERLSPKERKQGSSPFGTRDKDKTPSKLTPDMLHGQALKSLEKVDSPKYLPSPNDIQKSKGKEHAKSHDVIELAASKSKDKVEENSSPKKFPVPRNMLTPVNGESMVLSKDKAPVVTATASTSKAPVEQPPPKKRAFQMSAHEDWLELDDDIHANGHVSENNKQETSFVVNKPVSADVIQTPTLPEVTPVVAKVPEPVELKEAENVKSPPKTDFGTLGGPASEQGVGFKFPTPPLSVSTTQTEVLPQSAFQVEKVVPVKESQFQFSANHSSEFKPSGATSDLKAIDSTSVFSSVSKDNPVKFPVFNKVENGNDQKSTNLFGKSESLSSPAPASTTSTSAVFSFGSSSKNTTTSDATPVSSSPSMFSSLAPSFSASSGANTNLLFSGSFSNVNSVSTATTAASNPVFSTSVPPAVFSTSLSAPVFSFSSTVAPTSVVETGKTIDTNGKELKSTLFGSTSFATTTTGSGLFGFSSPAAATSTTTNDNNQSQSSFFNVTTRSQPSSTAVTQPASFQFGSTGASSSTSGTALFGSSSPAFGSSAPAFGSSAPAFGSSAPAFGSTPSFGISSVAASTEMKSGSSTGGTTPSIFGGSWQNPNSSGFGSTFSSPSPSPVFAFGGSSTPMPSASSSPIMFGSSNAGASTGSSVFSFTTTATTTNNPFGQSVFGNPTPVFGGSVASPNNNDQMSMEDTMAEDSMQTPSPVAPFGQAAPGFMFGSATPTPSPAPAFQFGGQAPGHNPNPNPFQSSSVEFNGGGGSFSLGSGGGDKSGRRIVRVKTKNRGRK